MKERNQEIPIAYPRLARLESTLAARFGFRAETTEFHVNGRNILYHGYAMACGKRLSEKIARCGGRTFHPPL